MKRIITRVLSMADYVVLEDKSEQTLYYVIDGARVRLFFGDKEVSGIEQNGFVSYSAYSVNDCDDWTENGYTRTHDTTMNTPFGLADNKGSLLFIAADNNAKTGYQLFVSNTGDMYIRTATNVATTAVFSAWCKTLKADGNGSQFIKGDGSMDSTQYATQSALNGLIQLAALKENVSNKTTEISASPDDTKYPTEKAVATELDKKVDKSAVIDIAHGGTGKTNAYDATNTLLSGLPEWTAVPNDNTQFIRRDTAGAISYGRVRFSTIWSYIKGKADALYATIADMGAKASQTDVDAINAKIPSAATSTNQLADKDFVNSSIQTSTATFAGTFESVSELPTTGVSVNDYAFVATTDTHGNTSYDRYKYNGTQWVFEYALNNSSFTAGQWNAINSGVTESILSGYDTHVASRNNPHAVTKAQIGLENVNNTSDADKPISTATQAALNQKEDAAHAEETYATNDDLSLESARIDDITDDIDGIEAYMSALNESVIGIGATITDMQKDVDNKGYDPMKVFFLEALEDNTIIGVEDNNFTYTGVMEYSLDGKSWVVANGTPFTFPTLNTGKRLYVRGTLSWGGGGLSQRRNFTCAQGTFSVVGNPDVLCRNATSLNKYHCIFRGCQGVRRADKMIVHNNANCVTRGMFYGCVNLETPPTILWGRSMRANACEYMFYGCASLKTTPELPVKTLTNYCYRSMFEGCVSLNTIPTLVATTLADYCYNRMFFGCAIPLGFERTADIVGEVTIPFITDVIGATTDMLYGNAQKHGERPNDAPNNVTFYCYSKEPEYLHLQSQFIKGDGSLDDTQYATEDALAQYAKADGTASQFIKGDGSKDNKQYVDMTYAVQAFMLCEKSSNKVTSLGASSTDNDYPSAKCVYNALQNLQPSGTAAYQNTGFFSDDRFFAGAFSWYLGTQGSSALYYDIINSVGSNVVDFGIFDNGLNGDYICALRNLTGADMQLAFSQNNVPQGRMIVCRYGDGTDKAMYNFYRDTNVLIRCSLTDDMCIISIELM